MRKYRISTRKILVKMARISNISRNHWAILKRISKNVSALYLSGYFHSFVDYSFAGLKITDYPKDIGEVKQNVIFDTLDILEKSGVVKAPEDGWKLETFVDPEIAKVV